MLNFGPASVTYNTVSLGDTFGGFSLKLNSVERNNVGEMSPEVHVNTGQGKINMYQWESSILIGDSTSLLDFGEVIFDGTPRYKLTLYSCKLLLSDTLEGGTHTQKAFVVDVYFKKDSNGRLMKIE